MIQKPIQQFKKETVIKEINIFLLSLKNQLFQNRPSYSKFLTVIPKKDDF